MKFGIFPVEGGDSWGGVVEQCRLAETVGFETCWVNDHQATEGENYWPAPLMRLASIATGTDTLEVVSSVLIAPLYHPPPRRPAGGHAGQYLRRPADTWAWARLRREGIRGLRRADE